MPTTPTTCLLHTYNNTPWRAGSSRRGAVLRAARALPRDAAAAGASGVVDGEPSASRAGGARRRGDAARGAAARRAPADARVARRARCLRNKPRPLRALLLIAPLVVVLPAALLAPRHGARARAPHA
eukprot:1168894-Pleurochrysis_carterae.AAC.3